MQRFFCCLAVVALVAGCGDDARMAPDAAPTPIDLGPVTTDLSRPDFGARDMGPDLGMADPTCFDRIQNGDETDVDCGGTACVACGPGAGCELDVDCALMTSCVDGFCRTPACMNEMLDTGEADVDCGGDCPACADGADCTMNADCASNRCEDSVCTSCGDGVQNGDESDVDCGGSDCSPCWGGESCGGPTDCMSGVCTSGSCVGAEVYLDSDFTTSDGGWTAGGSGVWEYATPTNTHIDAAYTGTMVWVTDADANYPASADGWVESPAMDLSGVTADPTLELFFIAETEDGWDGMWVELSTDGGSSWDKLLANDGAVNWYNNATDEWWDDVTGWAVARNILTGSAGNADVRIRIRFSSDGTGHYEGVAFDDVSIFEDLCTNGVQDVGEADVDCGGTCDLCPGGATCTTGATCASGSCSGGECDRAVFYDSDFEADDGSLTETGDLWEWGMPAGSVIDSASSGSNAWVTDLDAEYGNNELARLELPAFDLSGVGDDPLIQFDLWRDTESSFDGLWVEVSLDGGTTWDKVVDDGTFPAWYNNTTSSDLWFDSVSGGWERKVGTLTGTAGEADVRVRFVFDTDGSGINDGVAIDDLFIGAPAPDLAVEVLPSAELCDAGTVVVRNLGTASVTYFDLTTVADGASSTDRVTVALGPGGVYETTVAASSTISATVAIDGDGDPSNDSASLGVGAGIAVASGSAYLETFEADDGDWVATGTNSDWEHGEPTGSFIGNADSGMNAWVTDLSSTYNANQLSYLVSPCFDLSSLGTDPALSFSRIFELEATDDHVHVELTTDGGTTWTKLGAFGTGSDWYNDAAGDFWDGTSGAADAWSRSSHPLTGAAGQSRVRLRFVMVSDGSITDDGFGVDDVAIDP